MPINIPAATLEFLRTTDPGMWQSIVASATRTEHGVTLSASAMRELLPPGYPMPDRLRPLPPPSGPGTELKALLKKVGITASPGCSCNKRAQLMDENESKEPGWCDKNLETICDWLQEEATKRKLPFVRMAAKILVRQAIRNARKKGQ